MQGPAPEYAESPAGKNWEEGVDLMYRVLKMLSPADQIILAEMVEHNYDFIGEIINVAFERFDAATDQAAR